MSDEMLLILSEFFNGCIESNQLSSGDFEELYREKYNLVPRAVKELFTFVCGIGESSYELYLYRMVDNPNPHCCSLTCP